MTKQEKIKEAYGKYYEEMNPWIDEKGWFNKNAFYQKEFTFLKYEKIDLLFHHKGDFMIPTSIKEIENNNGWTKIESINDLPNIKGEYIIFKYGNAYTTTWISDDIYETPEYFKRYSHWRIKDKILEPIY